MNGLHYPKFYRQRLILLLLEQAGGVLSKMDLQKLLFLSHQKTGINYYAFVPYHYGSYSFQAAADVEALQTTGWLQSGDKNIILKHRLPPEKGLAVVETNKINRFMQSYKDYRGQKLLHYVYQYYPYYAVKSKIARDVVNQWIYDRIQGEKRRPAQKGPVLFTIGYEGTAFEEYLNKLIKNDIRLLCDVRNNPLSRKFGFSKGMLAGVLPKLGIKYVHVQNLGIVTEKRNRLNSEDDYNHLFAEYRKSLPQKETCLQELMTLLTRYGRIALTCFEKQPSFCHRHCISDYLKAEKGAEVIHL